jgi:3-deoxy-D-manno-octulosonic-acid transferase
MFFLYSLLLTIGFIIFSPLFLLRSGKYLSGFWQRLGYLPDFETEGKHIVWLHCVSVGETQAARPLVKEILKNFPDYKLVISTTTKTGQNLAREIFKNEASLVIYFPFDWRFTVRRALKRIKPNVILLMETEIWFNFIREAGKSGARVAIVNGRLSERSAKRYQLITRTLRRVFHYVEAALMQTNADAKRLLSFGIRGTKVKVTGNIKFDQDLTESHLTEEFRQRFDISADAPLIIAASTHAPEEKYILQAFKTVYKSSTDKLPRLMIVPRHPERFAEVEQLIRDSAFQWVKRSEKTSERDRSAEIILLDSIGELRAVYPLAEIVFVGGSLIPRGGQSILEPAINEKAIVTGFYTTNFKAAVEEFLAKDALIQLPKLNENQIAKTLADYFLELLQDNEKRETLAKNAGAVMLQNRGATEKTIEFLRPLFQVSSFVNPNQE